MRTTTHIAAACSEPMSIESLSLGHCGTHLSCMQESARGAVLRLQKLGQRHQKRSGAIPAAWPSKARY